MVASTSTGAAPGSASSSAGSWIRPPPPTTASTKPAARAASPSRTTTSVDSSTPVSSCLLAGPSVADPLCRSRAGSVIVTPPVPDSGHAACRSGRLPPMSNTPAPQGSRRAPLVVAGVLPAVTAVLWFASDSALPRNDGFMPAFLTLVLGCHLLTSTDAGRALPGGRQRPPAAALRGVRLVGRLRGRARAGVPRLLQPHRRAGRAGRELRLAVAGLERRVPAARRAGPGAMARGPRRWLSRTEGRTRTHAARARRHRAEPPSASSCSRTALRRPPAERDDRPELPRLRRQPGLPALRPQPDRARGRPARRAAARRPAAAWRTGPWSPWWPPAATPGW